MIRAAITGSLMILIVVILRVCFKRFPGKVRCALWILCCIRLILPFTLLLPILPQKTEVIPVTMQAAAVAETENVEAVTLDEPKEVSTVDKREDQKVDVKTILLCLYLIGVIVMLVSMLIGTIRVLRKTRYAVPRLQGEKDKYYACEGIGTAFVFGVFRPKIYVPFSLGDEELPFVLAHEAYHIRHRHYILKPLFYVVLSLYWFNPTVWLAWYFFGQDIEIACDEGVTGDYDKEKRTRYAEALLTIPQVKKHLLSAQVTFGEIPLRGRVERVIAYQPLSSHKRTLAAATPILIGVLFFTAAVPASAYTLRNDEENFGYDVVRDGKEYGFFSYNDPIVVREENGIEWLYNNYLDGQAYRKIRMDDTLRQEIIASVDKNMYYVRDAESFEWKTDPVTGLSYMYPAGYRSWMGAVVIENDQDERVFRELMDQYKSEYSELFMDDDVADIYAAMEVKGLCFRDIDGFVIVGNGGVQAINLSDTEAAWNVFFSPGEYGRLDDWLQENRDTFHGSLDFETWRPVFDELAISHYEGELDTSSKRYAAAYEKLTEGFGEYPPEGMSERRAREQIFNWMKYYDEDGDYTGSDGIAGMDATNIDPAERQVIIEIPDEYRQKLFDLVKEEFLKWQGMERPESKRSEVLREYQLSAKKEDRLKGTWTLNQYEQRYSEAFVETVKNANPSWDYGDDFDQNLITGITREDLEQRISSDGRELTLN